MNMHASTGAFCPIIPAIRTKVRIPFWTEYIRHVEPGLSIYIGLIFHRLSHLQTEIAHKKAGCCGAFIIDFQMVF